jgi:acetoin utilization deacetylase AcuC-like enzyme
MLLVATDPRYAEHDPGRGHPERPVRLRAVLEGLRAAELDGAIDELPARVATRAEIERVHRGSYLDELEAFCRRGGGALDRDTSASAASWDTAVLAAGAGLAAI